MGRALSGANVARSIDTVLWIPRSSTSSVFGLAVTIGNDPNTLGISVL